MTNGKFYRSMVRPSMVFGLEYWVVESRIEQIISTAQMRMLRQVSGITGEDRIRNEYLRGR